MLIQRIGNHDLPLPKQETMEAAGYDLRANYTDLLLPGEQSVIPTGFAMAIPAGMVGIVKPRSGLAVKHGIDIQAGVIDSDFRGEVCAVLINHGHYAVPINYGDRIAQLVVVPCYQGAMTEVEDLPDTDRGNGGFGSTGV